MKLTETTPKSTPPTRTWSLELSDDELRALRAAIGRRPWGEVKADIVNAPYVRNTDKALQTIHTLYEFARGALGID